MDRYEKEAIIYPTIIGTIIPVLLASAYFSTLVPLATEWLVRLAAFVGIFISINMVMDAIGYWFRELSASTSKYIIQYPLFKQDESQMPTTELLLWNSHGNKSRSEIEAIAKKVKKDFNLLLLTQPQETADPVEARKVVVDAVGKMREVTRDNETLQRYNRKFGFYRNLVGASFYAIILVIVEMIVNSLYDMGFSSLLWLAFLLQLLLALFAIIFIKAKGYEYARALYNAYMTTDLKKGGIV